MKVIYQIINTYEVEEMTVKEILDAFKEDKNAFYKYIDPVYPEDVDEFYTSMDWLQTRKPDKKLYVVQDDHPVEIEISYTERRIN